MQERKEKIDKKNKNFQCFRKSYLVQSVKKPTLPGIGPSIALKIINYRKENGKFAAIEDIKNVSGIGDSKFEDIKKYITV